jgi:hypothetical protein
VSSPTPDPADDPPPEARSLWGTIVDAAGWLVNYAISLLPAAFSPRPRDEEKP